MAYKVKSTTVILPKSMPLVDRISTASRELREWIATLGRPFNSHEAHRLRLTKHEQNGERHIFHYELLRRTDVDFQNKWTNIFSKNEIM